MIKLKSLLKEVVNFIENNEIMVIPSPKGDWKILIFVRSKDGKKYYDWQIGSPPDHYETYNINGRPYKMAVGGRAIISKPSENLEQVQADLAENLKKLGLPYTSIQKIKPRDLDSPEHKKFINQISNVVSAFNKEMEKPENKPKQFGAGPPEYGQWVTGEEIRNGRLKWVIDNYGDFWLVVKWSISPRQMIKASEFLKNYDHIISGKKAGGDYAREVYVRNEPFKGIQ